MDQTAGVMHSVVIIRPHGLDWIDAVIVVAMIVSTLVFFSLV